MKCKLTLKKMEPLVTKAKQAFIDAVFNENYTGFEEHFIAKYLVEHLNRECS